MVDSERMHPCRLVSANVTSHLMQLISIEAQQQLRDQTDHTSMPICAFTRGVLGIWSCSMVSSILCALEMVGPRPIRGCGTLPDKSSWLDHSSFGTESCTLTSRDMRIRIESRTAGSKEVKFVCSSISASNRMACSLWWKASGKTLPVSLATCL